MKISNFFLSELLKLKRSLLLYFYSFIAILFPIIIGYYFKNRITLISKSYAYMYFYEIIAIFTPLLVAITISLVFSRENNAGNFKNWFSLPISKAYHFTLQNIFFCLLYFIVLGIASTIFYFIIGKSNLIHFYQVIFITILFTIFTFTNYILTFTLSLKFGINGALIYGMFGTIVSLLATTELLDNFWFILPPTWQIRFISFYQISLSQQTKFKILLEYGISVLITIGVVILSLSYYKKWEKTK